MTRLKERDIDLIAQQIKEYNEELVRKTGHTLSEIAAHAIGMHYTDVPNPGPVAVLPMTCGQGVIGGFSETVAGILSFLGMSTFVPAFPDVKGFAETLERKAEIVFMADDDRFIAAHLKTGYCSDNSRATGKGYAAALDYLTGGLKDRSVLILGAGPVGRSAAVSVLGFGGKIAVYDKDSKVSEKLAQDILSQSGQYVHLEKDFDSAIKSHRAIVDACPEAEFITRDYLYSDTFISAPGVPLGVHSDALDQISSRLIHDPLQLGVATMLYELLNRIEAKRNLSNSI
ncbi:3-methylornithyl-N6-L-lysine dehydrogenase PylD [Desulfosporosinus youngiae]|uniref:Pyrrolysine biosynthesis protein PylD n=1 Tax=Desulfosporosinus youngiae DSM 17734 TaxID=768710 RepID=H5XS84_9FIRM|nr:3-methylornithyl-N6-L-lysine dehydrogenase PylD [Desulfosporosinus youngiae]EHQ87836.1 pyrrolysine biosynthesis protein PylD [Desulfosporosinus youngiae DSM 17734]